MRLAQARNQAAPSELIPALSIRRNKLIENQLDLLVVYTASVNPSGTIIINLPSNYNNHKMRAGMDALINQSPAITLILWARFLTRQYWI